MTPKWMPDRGSSGLSWPSWSPKRAADIAVRLRQPGRVLGALRLAASMAPLNESVHASLMLVLAAAGQQAEALTVFWSIRERLVGELGLDPGSELRAAHQRVLTSCVRR
jgi:hypothetical protein